MVYRYASAPDLDRTFAALADPTRRALLARLREHDETSVSDLAQPLPMSLPAVMKHLDVLAGAGLIARQKIGRTVACRLNAAPMAQAMEWLNRYERFWTHSLDRLTELLEDDECQQPSPSRASPSGAASRPRPRKSSRRGPTPRR